MTVSPSVMRLRQASLGALGDHGRGDELVAGHVVRGGVVVVVLDGVGRGLGAGDGIGGRAATGEAGVSLLDTLPAVVAVHGPVAPDDAGDLPYADLVECLLDLLDVTDAGVRPGVAPVGKQVQVHAGAVELSAQRDDRRGVGDQAVHARIADDAHEVHGFAFVAGAGDRLRECCDLAQFAVATGLRDADRVLIDDASCADVLVPHFGVAHGAVEQADRLAAGGDEGVRPLLAERIVDRGLREFDRVERVVLRVRVLAPAVADDQDAGGIGRLGGGHRGRSRAGGVGERTIAA